MSDSKKNKNASSVSNVDIYENITKSDYL